MSDIGAQLTALNREQIGLLTVSDLERLESGMTVSERREYVARVSAVFDVLQRELKGAIAIQIDQAIRNAETWEEVLICRGGVNMGEILLEHFGTLHAEHIDNIKQKEEFNPHDVI